MPDKNNARVIAHKAICEVVLQKRSLSEALFPVNQLDISFAKSLAFGSIRFYHHLNDIITPRLDKPLEKKNLDLHCLMVLGAYQIIYTDISRHAAINETVEVARIINKKWAKGLINAILRGIDRDQKVILKSSHYSHPSWLVKKIKKDYPENYENIFIENNKQAPMSIRVHPSIGRENYKKKLMDQNIDSYSSEISEQSLTLREAISVDKLPDFEKGSCYVQDVSAQLAGYLISPKKNDSILDACCAPGGKTTHLAELGPDSEIIALDFDEMRLKRVRENLTRMKVKNVKVVSGDATKMDWWNQKKFDSILLDAPCTGTGVIRRHPDIKLLRKPKDLGQVIETQSSILENLWTMLKPGGKLLYATCSILKEENENQINRFLEKTSDAKIEEINLSWGLKTTGSQQLPHNNHDGFYYAQLVKQI